MTSQVNPNSIDGAYPVAGQDNDSQGFRDNFTNIRNNFTYIKAEVEDLQNKVLLKTNLTNSTLSNDLLGNAMVNASFTGWRETYNDIGAVSGSITVDFANGNYQKITLSGATTVNFSWPSNATGQVASIKLWVNFPTADTTRTLTFGTPPTLGDPDTIAGYSVDTITFNASELANNTDYLFEIWTADAGTTLGIKDLIRNRDIDLSGFAITGNATFNGNVTHGGGFVVTGYQYLDSPSTNFWANINKGVSRFIIDPSSTTLAIGNVTLPNVTVDGTIISIHSTANITSFNANTLQSGTTIKPNVSVTISAGTGVEFFYHLTENKWYKIR